MSRAPYLTNLVFWKNPGLPWWAPMLLETGYVLFFKWSIIFFKERILYFWSWGDGVVWRSTCYASMLNPQHQCKKKKKDLGKPPMPVLGLRDRCMLRTKNIQFHETLSQGSKTEWQDRTPSILLWPPRRRLLAHTISHNTCTNINKCTFFKRSTNFIKWSKSA